MRNRCKICKCEKSTDQLDSRGRCQGCADAKTATDLGYSYGKYMSLMAPQPKTLAQIIAEASKRKCRYCGSVIPGYIKSDECCGSIACESARLKRIQDENTRTRRKEKRSSQKEEVIC